jgi:hypothetical protein
MTLPELHTPSQARGWSTPLNRVLVRLRAGVEISERGAG